MRFLALNSSTHLTLLTQCIFFTVSPLFVIEFLHRVVDTFTDYFSGCSESIIKDQIVVVYEVTNCKSTLIKTNLKHIRSDHIRYFAISNLSNILLVVRRDAWQWISPCNWKQRLERAYQAPQYCEKCGQYGNRWIKVSIPCVAYKIFCY